MRPEYVHTCTHKSSSNMHRFGMLTKLAPRLIWLFTSIQAPIGEEAILVVSNWWVCTRWIPKFRGVTQQCQCTPPPHSAFKGFPPHRPK
mmetsp:Transcript_49174/g.87787  ORF Transcript_49174/g.87787 Transcript_49174/m.87787 type:complete len:89 (-) Transcript_49174:95-361(-)